MISWCKIIGDITIGDNSIVGAEFSCIKDVPPNCNSSRCSWYDCERECSQSTSRIIKA